MLRSKKILLVLPKHVLDACGEEIEKIRTYSIHGHELFVTNWERVLSYQSNFDDIQILITGFNYQLSDLCRKLKSLKWIQFLSSGLDTVEQIGLKQDVKVTSCKGVNATFIAEYVYGIILAESKNLFKYHDDNKSKTWSRIWSGSIVGSKMLVLGAGNVGQEISRIGKAFSIDVTLVGSKPSRGRQVYSFSQIQPILSQFNYIVCALPLTSQTTGFVDSRFFDSLSNAMFIDVSRGGVVDLNCISSALKSGQLRYAALDVFPTEPLEDSSDLWTTNNLFLTPHIAGTGPNYLSRAFDIFLLNFQFYRSGKIMPTQLNLKKGY